MEYPFDVAAEPLVGRAGRVLESYRGMYKILLDEPIIDVVGDTWLIWEHELRKVD